MNCSALVGPVGPSNSPFRICHEMGQGGLSGNLFFNALEKSLSQRQAPVQPSGERLGATASPGAARKPLLQHRPSQTELQGILPG